MRRFLVAILATILPLALSATGVAAVTSPLTITADWAAGVPAGHNWSYNDFFPRTLSVHRGATIQFAIQGFHTATLLPAGMSADAGRKSLGLIKADGDDTIANPNGSSHIAENLPALFPVPGGCGSAAHPCAFDGTSPVSSGAPLGGPMPPTRVKITAPYGFYRFLCLVHPNMQGWLAVVPGAFHATTSTELAASVHTQVFQDRQEGYHAEAAASIPRSVLNSDGTRTWTMTAGTGSPDGRVAVDEMLPRSLAIKKGDKVTWVSRSINEPHTVTFPRDLHTDMSALCEAGSIDNPATPTVIPPTGPQDFTCGGPPVEFELDGGNGVNHVTSRSTVADSGIIASAKERAGFGLPASAANSHWTASFVGAARTSYTYLCQIHTGMVGTIVVH